MLSALWVCCCSLHTPFEAFGPPACGRGFNPVHHFRLVRQRYINITFSFSVMTSHHRYCCRRDHSAKIHPHTHTRIHRDLRSGRGDIVVNLSVSVSCSRPTAIFTGTPLVTVLTLVGRRLFFVRHCLCCSVAGPAAGEQTLGQQQRS